MQLAFVLMVSLVLGLFGTSVWRSIDRLYEDIDYYCQEQKHNFLVEGLIAYGIARLASDYALFSSLKTWSWICDPWPPHAQEVVSSRVPQHHVASHGVVHYAKKSPEEFVLKCTLFSEGRAVANREVILVYQSEKQAFIVYR